MHARPCRSYCGRSSGICGPRAHRLSSYLTYMALGTSHHAKQGPHPAAILPLAFLAFSDVDGSQGTQHVATGALHTFRAQLCHASLAMLLAPLEAGIQRRESDVARCADGHFRRAFYQIGPVIVDSPSASALPVGDVGDANSEGDFEMMPELVASAM
ncbi:uncharacterized protein B0H18DRAFT_984796 [Fomitopsis serialis]|uniref:uncharacterized protein n=1 Tax=Fomitopsis serialis TaxID=139415 RepID=UPI002008C2CA|nr:uncharacterized protein B0H18DRAFT_984796 [Neoantrodia serialis]KAH9932953.1 hypothetical protein B0H18DRAFT_984796 [Neoantrodia serialis]